jgi:hypothetical protein
MQRLQPLLLSQSGSHSVVPHLPLAVAVVQTLARLLVHLFRSLLSAHLRAPVQPSWSAGFLRVRVVNRGSPAVNTNVQASRVDAANWKLQRRARQAEGINAHMSAQHNGQGITVWCCWCC